MTTIESEIKSIYEKGLTNPSGIVFILYSRGYTGRYVDLRKQVLIESQKVRS